MVKEKIRKCSTTSRNDNPQIRQALSLTTSTTGLNSEDKAEEGDTDNYLPPKASRHLYEKYSIAK